MPIKLRVLWPERVAFAAAAAVAAGILSLWLVLAIGVGSLGAANLDRAALGWLFDAETGLVLPFWLGLRAIFVGIALVRRHRGSPRNRQVRRAKVLRDPRTGA